MNARSLPRQQNRTRLRRAGFALAALAGLALLPLPADAQGFGWFGRLFGGGQPNQQQPSYPGSGPSRGGGDYYVPRHHPKRRDKPQAEAPASRPAPREATVEKPPQKKNASTSVYVFGDSFGQFLASGLDDALADRQDVAVVHKAKGSTGLVNAEFFDWPKTIDTLLAGKDKIDVAVMMLGSNDRQPITQDGKTYDVGSDDWKRIYNARVSAIDEAFKKKGVPLIWVGVPITKSSDFADTMAMLNDMYRDDASKTGATYVDTWEPFSDEDGDFAAYGPDIDGQTVRLRSADGILFTHAGARKLAHFVEGPVRRVLDGKAPPPALPTGPAQAQDGKPGPAGTKGAETARAPAAPKPEAGPIVNLNQMPVAGNGELAAPTAYRGAPDKDDAAPAGRADDARWPAAGTKSP